MKLIGFKIVLSVGDLIENRMDIVFVNLYFRRGDRFIVNCLIRVVISVIGKIESIL